MTQLAPYEKLKFVSELNKFKKIKQHLKFHSYNII